MEDKRQEFRERYSDFDAQLPKQCQNCGNTEDLAIHHIVPLIVGGNNVITNMARLCGNCHNKAHGIDGVIDHSGLIRKGLEKRKQAGKPMGRPFMDNETVEKALVLHKAGTPIKKIIAETGISQGKLYKEINKRKAGA